MFHPCSAYKDYKRGNDDLSLVRPHHLIFLGKGDNGIVLLLNGTFAVKITDAKRFLREMQISCQLATLKPDTQAFITAHGWLRYRGIVKSWLAVLPEYNQQGERIAWEAYADQDLVYIFMEHSTFRIQMPIKPSSDAGVVFWEYLNATNAKKVLFILLHALYVARKKLQFSHNDLHDGQIMLFRRPDPMEPIVLQQGAFVINGCPFIPKLIDFGDSKMGEKGDDFSDDVAQLFSVFVKMGTAQNLDQVMTTPEYEEAAGSSRRRAGVIWTLLRLPYFAEFAAPVNTIKTAITCMGCMAAATHLIEGTHHHVCAQCPARVNYSFT